MPVVKKKLILMDTPGQDIEQITGMVVAIRRIGPSM